MQLIPIKTNGPGGGNRGPDNEGFLDPLWRHWAKSLVAEQLQNLENLPAYTPQQYVDCTQLKAEFDRVAESTAAACNAIRKHSFWYPLAKPFMGL